MLIEDIVASKVGKTKAIVRGKHTESSSLAEFPTLSKAQDGWLWSLIDSGKMSQAEMEEWEAEGLSSHRLMFTQPILSLATGDRVQFFRAQAEMERWQEQFEIKHAEFMRCIKTFQSLKDIWNTLAINGSRGPEIGSTAFARRQSAMFAQMENECREHYKAIGEPFFVNLPPDITLAQRVSEFRQKEKAWVTAVNEEA
jgi:hypothetical protein